MELIVVIVVLGLCAATVFPRVPGLLLREPEPERSARRFLRMVQYTQELAIAGESTLVLQIDMRTGSYRVEAKDSHQESPGAVPSDLRGQCPGDVAISDADPVGGSSVDDSLSIEFHPEGWCDPATLRFTTSDARTVTVVIPEWSDMIELPGEEPTR